VLVTGGAGFVGTNLIKKLLKDGHIVVSLDNYSTGHKDNRQKGCTYFDVDITEKFDEWPEKFDVIFHLAALARIQPSIKNPTPSLQTNVVGTLNVLEYARKTNTQVIYSGSSTKHAGIFKSPYAWSKHSGEELCKLYSKVYNLNTTICRFYNVYGNYHIRTGDYATVIGIFERQFISNKPLTITGDGEQRRDFTHIDDIVNGLIKCVGKEHKAEEFEFGSGVNYSINEVAAMFESESGLPLVDYIPARPGEYPTTLADYSKAKEKLDWCPTKNIKEYITKWVEENKNV
tara:strand:+ start:573 stop:1436 length:864 start_codon:yes stop_codon:yes gene_type:complete